MMTRNEEYQGDESSVTPPPGQPSRKRTSLAPVFLAKYLFPAQRLLRSFAGCPPHLSVSTVANERARAALCPAPEPAAQSPEPCAAWASCPQRWSLELESDAAHHGSGAAVAAAERGCLERASGHRRVNGPPGRAEQCGEVWPGGAHVCPDQGLFWHQPLTSPFLVLGRERHQMRDMERESTLHAQMPAQMPA
ncbi:hypothetical protein H8958_021966 [Nasalis larvatus]